ncbi:MAG: hypothetical protein QXU54_02795 [Candidatus Micrarchaeia archaeon]
MRTEILVVAVAVLLALIYIAANNPFVVEKTRSVVCPEDNIAIPERVCGVDDAACRVEAVQHKKACDNVVLVEESALGTFRAEMREFGGQCLITISAVDGYSQDVENKTMECVVPINELRLLYEQPKGKQLYAVFPYSPDLLERCTGELKDSLSVVVKEIYESKCP